MKLVYFVLLFISLYHSSGAKADNSSSSYENTLLANLFKSYNKKVRPVVNSSDTVEVTFDVKLSKVIKVDSKSQQLTVSVWITQTWKNAFLTWNKSTVGGISSITVDPSEIWVPDVGLLNNADETISVAGGRNKFQTNVIVRDGGQCIWRSPAIFTSDCEISVEYWPFDTQKCQMKFSSFTMTKRALALKLQSQRTNSKADQFITSGDWTVQTIDVLRKEDLSSCCSDAFSVVGFELILKRKPMYFVLNLLIPSAILCLLSLLSFIIPSESGERIGFITTIMLAMSVYLLIIADVLPETSKQIPITGLLFIVAITENAVILIETIIVLRCFHGTGEPPAWLQRFYCCCCPCLGKKPPSTKSRPQKSISQSNLYVNEVALKELDAPPHIPAIFEQNDSQEFESPTWQDISILLNQLFFILSIIMVAATYAAIYLNAAMD
ncbi:neuronal acetylcholine receptor subunit alpha-7-like [Actinia tenebrosa]|uniref:Neuronal acetylcholine receptor subunit alpha-7-like n=1 Tax=Actinia tenebrosa TaxID=6105 RepID=A0A6P8IMV9_ACTTE|nr:neuronal acetylcholine receptor subunit alpha-7-like [Actinia tenebrosa]